MRYSLAIAAAAIVPALSSVTASADQLQITVENLSPTGGLFLTPAWFGFHDGSFDLFDVGSAASVGLERLAEDGSLGDIGAEFDAATSGNGQATVVTGPGGFGSSAGQPPLIDPGETTSVILDVDPSNQYFQFASMVLPSNDAFVGNSDPAMVFDASGNFTGTVELLILGSNVYDAGTEDNTELDAAFLNQTGPNTGDTTLNGVIELHPGFLADGNILGGTNAAGQFIDPTAADFTAAGYEYVRVTVSLVPEPASATLALLGAGGLVARRRRR